jgi:hypothetical protein
LITDKLRKDIELPYFYDDVADLDDLEFFMGSHFVDKPHYEKQEQIMCAIEGHLSVIMIPHVNRQEVYAGQMKDSVYHEKETDDQKQINVSPVNFFIPNMKQYPHFGSTFRS